MAEQAEVFFVYPQDGWPFGMDAGDMANFEAGARAEKAEGFHGAVLKVIKEDLMSFAPKFLWHSKKTSSRASGRQAGDFDDVSASLRRPGGDAAGGGRPPASDVSLVALSNSRADIFGNTVDAVSLTNLFKASPPSTMLPSTAPEFAKSWEEPELGVHSVLRDGGVKPKARGLQVAIPEGLEESLPPAMGFVYQDELPRFAPGSGGGRPSATLGSRHFPARSSYQRRNDKPETPRDEVLKKTGSQQGVPDDPNDGAIDRAAAPSVIDQAALSQALSNLLDRQARLPPSGGAGFDPRLTPAWAGLKLPG